VAKLPEKKSKRDKERDAMSVENRRDVWSVTELVSILSATVEAEEQLKNVWVEGEISNFTQNSKSRHMYFTLKDEHSKIRAVMFAGNNRRLRFTPKDGDRVLARGSLAVYGPEGAVQLYVHDMRLSGVGDLFVAYQRLKEKLVAEGLFDGPKKPLPTFPKKVGVITSPDGAAVRDIITTMRRRFPLASILLFPVSVQGEKAATEIAAAIEHMNERGEVDVLIVGRGGGSIEELWAFNEEIVVRGISRSAIPVVSAVGHETDVTLSDFAADWRAATPTAAAELVVPHITDLKERLCGLEKRLLLAVQALIERRRERLERSRQLFRKPDVRLLQFAQKLDSLEQRLQQAWGGACEKRKHRLEQMRLRLAAHHPGEMLKRESERLMRLKNQLKAGVLRIVREKGMQHVRLLSRLEALSPLKVMQRGYALVYRYGTDELIKSSRWVHPGDLIRVKLVDGELKCQVWKAEEKAE
jgi:exodeoxyribonuclease VII large subunit